MRTQHTRFLVIASLAFVLPGYAMADEAASGEWDGAAIPLVASNTSNELFGSVSASETLDQYRGGSEFVRSDMELNGTTAYNSATNVSTGTNVISSGSFAHMNGMPMVIQNSGANVLIQNATIINLQLN